MKKSSWGNDFEKINNLPHNNYRTYKMWFLPPYETQKKR